MTSPTTSSSAVGGALALNSSRVTGSLTLYRSVNKLFSSVSTLSLPTASTSNSFAGLVKLTAAPFAIVGALNFDIG